MVKRDAIFISGVGSNLKSVLDHFPKNKPLIYANKKCSGLAWAIRRGSKPVVVSLKLNEDWLKFASDLNQKKVRRVLLLGFMKIIPPSFLENFKGEVINLHPSLLPYYPGLKSIEKAFKDGATMGATLHKVTEGVDEGPSLMMRQSRVDKNDFKVTKQNVHFTEQAIVCKYLNTISF